MVHAASLPSAGKNASKTARSTLFTSRQAPIASRPSSSQSLSIGMPIRYWARALVALAFASVTAVSHSPAS